MIHAVSVAARFTGECIGAGMRKRSGRTYPAASRSTIAA